MLECILKILWKRGEIVPQEQFHLFSIIFCNLSLDFCVKTRTRFSLRDKRLFEIIEVEITRVDCILVEVTELSSKSTSHVTAYFVLQSGQRTE